MSDLFVLGISPFPFCNTRDNILTPISTLTECILKVYKESLIRLLYFVITISYPQKGHLEHDKISFTEIITTLL